VIEKIPLTTPNGQRTLRHVLALIRARSRVSCRLAVSEGEPPMRRVIILLPNPDLLQLANCHKYVTRLGDNKYSHIYTFTTSAGACGDVEKILMIGHGKVGGFEEATVDEVANAIIASGMPLTGHGKIAFDTCYAGSHGELGDLASALHLVRVRLKKHNFDCNVELTGATGPSVTIGGDKRLVVDPAKLQHAGGLQGQMMKKHGVNFFAHRPDWNEGASSATIAGWAQQEHANLDAFAKDFRSVLGPDLDTGTGRKVTIEA
jgi:hypothetical protein